MQNHIDVSGMSRLTAYWTHGVTQLHSTVLRCFGAGQKGVQVEIQIDTMAHARSAELFAQALREDSNVELDWLWYATKMTSNAQRRVCVQRALQINPHSELAKRDLATLAGEESA